MNRAEARAVAKARLAETSMPQVVVRVGDGYEARTLDGTPMAIDEREVNA